jgi:hypothetical protein
LIDELSKWKVSRMEEKIAAVTLPMISVSQLRETLIDYIRVLKSENAIRYEEHAKTCTICLWRKNINDGTAGYCRRWKELQ